MPDLVAFLTARLDETEHALTHLPKRARELPWQPRDPEFGAQPRWVIDVKRDDHGWMIAERMERSIAEYIAAVGDPARVLAEITAKRAIIKLHKMTTYPERWGELRHHPDDEAPAPPGPGWALRMPKRSHLGELTGGSMYACSICDADRDYGYIPRAEEGCETLRALAAPYADHPDFDPAWRTG